MKHPSKTQGPPAADVTIGLRGGDEITGRAPEGFSPYQTRVTVIPRGPGGVAAKATTVPTEDVVFVGRLRDPGEAAPAAPPADMAPLRVELGRGRTLEVSAPPRARWGAMGFVAVPTDPASPFRDIFFFRRAFEHSTPTGREGVLVAETGDLLPAGRSVGAVLRRQRSNPPRGPDSSSSDRRRHMRLGEIIATMGLVHAKDVERAASAQQAGERLGETLVRLGLLSELDLSRVLAEKFHVPFIDLDECDITSAAWSDIPTALLRRHRILPIDATAQSLTIAMSDPLAIDGIDALRLLTGKRVTAVLAVRSQIARYLSERLGVALPATSDEDTGEFATILRGILESGGVRPSASPESESTIAESDAGIIRLVNRLISDAFHRGASDIHIEPGDRLSDGRIRLRIDGECVPYHDVPAPVMAPLGARVKIMSELDIAERRRPQDGKLRLRVDETDLELRVATIPTVSGSENVVLRLLPASVPRPLDRMDLNERNLRELGRLLESPYGLLLCVGPTGSGKTTTLHSALARINSPSMKIWTIEDPVEITQPGLCQVQVRRKAGMDFATAMRAFLRADPDVIMVGEMRDVETVSTAVEASLTGHLVLSTLHTNSAPETVTRLLDMGVEPFGFADSLIGVLAQRLVRCLCAVCNEPSLATTAEVDVLTRAFGDREGLRAALGIEAEAALLLWRGAGCGACAGTGYRGRAAIHELLVVDDEMRASIVNRASADDIRRMAVKGGMTTLLQDGIAKAVAGLTDLRSVLAVCSR